MESTGTAGGTLCFKDCYCKTVSLCTVVWLLLLLLCDVCCQAWHITAFLHIYLYADPRSDLYPVFTAHLFNIAQNNCFCSYPGEKHTTRAAEALSRPDHHHEPKSWTWFGLGFRNTTQSLLLLIKCTSLLINTSINAFYTVNRDWRVIWF